MTLGKNHQSHTWMLWECQTALQIPKPLVLISVLTSPISANTHVPDGTRSRAALDTGLKMPTDKDPSRMKGGVKNNAKSIT